MIDPKSCNGLSQECFSITIKNDKFTNGNHNDQIVNNYQTKDNNFDSLEDQIMAGIITGVSTINSFDNLTIEKPISNGNCNWLHDKIYYIIRWLFSENNK